MVKSFGLTVSIAKTKFMVARCNIIEEDKQLIAVEGDNIVLLSHVNHHLEVVISDNG